ncbi:AMP-binding protein [Ferrovibrio sp.]|uniref:AMP-binding protein n=1 Tax=Ferrovibrio sp. TaxID=1917215 RepID=UPI003514F051
MNRLTEAYTRGESAEPLLRLTVHGLLARTVERHGAREALVVRHQGIRWSYYDLARAVDDLAAGLLALGLQKGDRIGIWSPNRAEWVVAQFATARIGLILVNINPAYRIAELEFALNKVQAKALIVAPRFKTSDYLGMLLELAPDLAEGDPGALHLKRLPHLRCIVRLGEEKTPGMVNYDAVLRLAGPAQRARLDQIAAGLDPDEAINIQFTSGTTGLPKGATLTHYNIVNNGYFTARCMKLSERDRLCIPVPLYHCFGMVLSNLACVSHGACMVFPGEGFDAKDVLEAVQAERCTALHGVPTMFIAELDHPDFGSYDLSSLRTGIMAGAPCPIEVMKRVVRDMGMREVTIAYGMTETSPVSFQSGVDDPLERRVATVGRIHPHVEVKIVGERGETLRPGEKGELCTRGYSVMRGYWDEPGKTAEAVDAAGWMHTGDLAVLDEEGYCNIVGRVKDMVIRGGENLFPREIEEYLFRHPNVQDVQVFGVPDAKYGEELCAWIVPKPGSQPTEEDIRGFCRGQIAHQKIPRYIRFVDAFPVTVTGKAQKFMMRKAMVEELGLREAATA